MELIKIVLKFPLEKFKYWFMNLALPLFAALEPISAQKIPITEEVSVTLWDRWEVKKGVSTLQDFVKHFATTMKLTVVGVAKRDGKMVYMSALPMYKKKLPKKMRELLGQKDGQKYCDLVVTFYDADGQQVKNAPVVRYFFRKSKKPT